VWHVNRWSWPLVRRFVVQDTSMQPALEPGDRLVALCWRLPSVGDIVVLRHPETAGAWLVKRVREVAPDGFDVRGDNVNVSQDSRAFGRVPARLVIGTVVYRYLPAERRGPIR
jgi:nickel-type superoxide dismutase maturation protease